MSGPYSTSHQSFVSSKRVAIQPRRIAKRSRDWPFNSVVRSRFMMSRPTQTFRRRGSRPDASSAIEVRSRFQCCATAWSSGVSTSQGRNLAHFPIIRWRCSRRSPRRRSSRSRTCGCSGNWRRATRTSPRELQPVLEVVVKSAARFCGADDAIILRLDGEHLRAAAHHGPIPVDFALPVPCVRGTVGGRSVLERRAVHVTDLQAEAEEFPEGSAFATRLGARTTLGVPLLREGAAVGTIQLRRAVVNPFTDKQIALLQTFADQAVIAIENVRLFQELEARTAELTRSVGELTALGEVSQALSSTLDVETVLNTIVSRASQLAGAAGCSIYEYNEAA